MDFKFHLSKPRDSLQAYIDFKFHISKRTSSQAYFDLKLPLHSQSIIEKCERSSKLLMITKTTYVHLYWQNAGRIIPFHMRLGGGGESNWSTYLGVDRRSRDLVAECESLEVAAGA